MARKPDYHDGPTVPPSTGIELLKKQIEAAQKLLANRPLTSTDHDAWELLTRNYLEKAFGRDSPNVSSIVGGIGAFVLGESESYYERLRADDLLGQINRMSGLVELLRTEVTLERKGTIEPEAPHGHKVFLVHGHDEAALQESARFLEKLGQEVVILREQPNKGKTIIEKFETFADVGFAVVLLTADDRGGSVKAPFEDQKPRARQNVVLELGYFLGRLTRNRVCALYRQGVEIPSDYSGVIFIPFDEAGGWKLLLAKELKAANLPVDMNKAF